MKQVYLDINGGILDDIIGLKSDNRIDEVLQKIVNSSPTAKAKEPQPIVGLDSKPKKEKGSKKKKEKEQIAMRKVKVRRIK
jgi:hypothetical protein